LSLKKSKQRLIDQGPIRLHRRPVHGADMVEVNIDREAVEPQMEHVQSASTL